MKARIKFFNSGGAEVSVDGGHENGFVPDSHLVTYSRKNRPSSGPYREINVLPLQDNKYSERNYRKDIDEKVIKALTRGEVVPGVVKSVHEKYAFIDMGGITDGYLSISDMSSNWLDEPNVSKGEKVQLRVKKVSHREDGRLRVTLCAPEVFERVEYENNRISKLTYGSEVKGVVREVNEKGAFIDMGGITDGRLHISDMSANLLHKPNVSEGEKVRLRVKSDPERDGDGKLNIILCTHEVFEERDEVKSRPEWKERLAHWGKVLDVQRQKIRHEHNKVLPKFPYSKYETKRTGDEEVLVTFHLPESSKSWLSKLRKDEKENLHIVHNGVGDPDSCGGNGKIAGGLRFEEGQNKNDQKAIEVAVRFSRSPELADKGQLQECRHDVNISRQRDALEQFQKVEIVNLDVARAMLDINKAKLQYSGSGGVRDFFNPDVEANENQSDIVSRALAAEPLFLIQGPPGTGKTTVITEIIQQEIKRNPRCQILLTSQTNIAVNNVMEKLEEGEQKDAFLRFGTSDSTKPHREWTLEGRVQAEFETRRDRRIEKLESDLCELKGKLETTVNFLKDAEEQRGGAQKDLEDIACMTDPIASLVDLNREWGVAREKVKKVRELSDLNTQIESVMAELKSLDQQIADTKAVLKSVDKRMAVLKLRYDLFIQLKSVDKRTADTRTELQSVDKRITDTKTELQSLNNWWRKIVSFRRIRRLKGQLGTAEVNRAKLEEQLREAEDIKTELEGRLGAAEVNRAKLEEQLQEAEDIKTELEGRLGAAEINRAKLEEQLREAEDIKTDVQEWLRLNGNIGEEEEIKAKIRTVLSATEPVEWQRYLRRLDLVVDEELPGRIRTAERTHKKWQIEAKRSLSNRHNEVVRLRKSKDTLNSGIGNVESKIEKVRNVKLGEEERKEIKRKIIDNTRVVGATCSYSANRDLSVLFEGYRAYDVVIIDEAAKATEPEVLVPLQYAKKMILVGDEKQLPPYLDEEDFSEENLKKYKSDYFSVHSKQEFDDLKKQLSTSLFQTLVEQAKDANPDILRSLTTQYRMHPSTGSLVSEVFYNRLLENGPQKRKHGIEGLSASTYWHSTGSFPGRQRGEQRLPEGGFYNTREVEVIKGLADCLEAKYRKLGSKPEIGIITGYRGQAAKLNDAIKPNDNKWQALDIEIATVDSFQGRDKDIVLFSVVRSNNWGTVGFLKDPRRLNVALSRAKNLLIIVGDPLTAEKSGKKGNSYLNDVLQYVKKKEDCELVRKLPQLDS